jgi:hypothetical protein
VTITNPTPPPGTYGLPTSAYAVGFTVTDPVNSGATLSVNVDGCGTSNENQNVSNGGQAFTSPLGPVSNCTITISATSSTGNTGSATFGPYNFWGPPTITGLNPTNVPENTGQFTLTVNGQNYFSDAGRMQVYWGSTLLATKYVSQTELDATVTQDLDAIGKKGPYTITVHDSITGTTSPSGNNTFTVTPIAPPSIQSFNPPSSTAGDPPLTLTIIGSGFSNTNPSSYVLWNGNPSPRAPLSITSTQITLGLNSSDLATAGTPNVQVCNGSNNCGSALAYQINAKINPSILTVNPPSVTEGNPDFTLTLTGTNFNANDVVYWNNTTTGNLPTVYVPATQQLLASVPSSNVAIGTHGNINIYVVDQSVTGVLSGPHLFTINQIAKPSVTSLNPSQATIGDSGATITVTGTNFTNVAPNASYVLWNGTLPKGVTYLSATNLIFQANATDLATSGSATVQVCNGSNSNCSPVTGPQFFVNPKNSPTINPDATGLNPNQATAGTGPYTLTINGTNFVPGNNVDQVYWEGSSANALSTTYVSPTQLTAILLAKYIVIGNEGPHTLMVQDTSPSGGHSGSATFTVIGLIQPSVTSLNPSQATVGDSGATITVTGTNFTNVAPNASYVLWNGNVPKSVTYLSATNLIFQVNATDLGTPGSATVQVCNGSNSNCSPVTGPQFFVNPKNTPTINSDGTGLQPDHVTEGSGALTLTINGTNFVGGTVDQVYWDDTTPLQTQFISATQLTAHVLAGNVAVGTHGPHLISVHDTSPGGKNSLDSTFFVNQAGAPQINVQATSLIDNSDLGTCGWPASTASCNFNPTGPIQLHVSATVDPGQTVTLQSMGVVGPGNPTGSNQAGTITYTLVTSNVPSPGYALSGTALAQPSGSQTAIPGTAIYTLDLSGLYPGTYGVTTTNLSTITFGWTAPKTAPGPGFKLIGYNIVWDSNLGPDISGNPVIVQSIAPGTLSQPINFATNPKTAGAYSARQAGTPFHTATFVEAVWQDATGHQFKYDFNNGIGTEADTNNAQDKQPSLVSIDNANATDSTFRVVVRPRSGDNPPPSYVHVTFDYLDDTNTTVHDECPATLAPITNNVMTVDCSPNKSNAGNTNYTNVQAQVGGSAIPTDTSWSLYQTANSTAWTMPTAPGSAYIDPTVSGPNSIGVTVDFAQLSQDNSIQTSYQVQMLQNFNDFPLGTSTDPLMISSKVKGATTAQLVTVSGLAPITNYYVQTVALPLPGSPFAAMTGASAPQGPISTGSPQVPGTFVSSSSSSITGSWNPIPQLLNNVSQLQAGTTDATGAPLPISNSTSLTPPFTLPVQLTVNNLPYSNTSYTLTLVSVNTTLAQNTVFPGSDFVGYTLAATPPAPAAYLPLSGLGKVMNISLQNDPYNSPDSTYVIEVALNGAAPQFLGPTGTLSATASAANTLTFAQWPSTIMLPNLTQSASYSITVGVMQKNPAKIILSTPVTVTTPGGTIGVTYPTLSGVSLDAYLFGVGLSGPFTATFTTAMDTQTMATGNFVTLTNLDGGANVPVTLSFPDTQTLVVTPTSALAPVGHYQLNIAAGIPDLFHIGSTNQAFTQQFFTALDPAQAATVVSPYDTTKADSVQVNAGALGSSQGSFVVARTKLVPPTPNYFTSPIADVQAAIGANQNLVTVSQVEVLVFSNATGTNPTLVNAGSPITLTMMLRSGTDAPSANASSIDASTLGIYFVDTTSGAKTLIPQTTSLIPGGAQANIQKSGVYILAGAVSTNLSGAYAWPVPFKPSAGHTNINFVNLAAGSTVRIFTITGELVNTLTDSGNSGTIQWPVKNSDGKNVASGVYIYQIKNSFSEKRGKLMIIR